MVYSREDESHLKSKEKEWVAIMEWMYRSTRNAANRVTASQAILQGLAEDGGLYVPEQIPALDLPLATLGEMNYHEVAYAVLSRFLTDYTEEELKYCIRSAYDRKFDTEEIVPIRKADGSFYLELFHGATIAFKDMALSILPYLMTTAAQQESRGQGNCHSDRHLRRYRKGSAGRICRCTGDPDHRLLPEGRCQRRTGKADGDTEGEEYLRHRHPWQFRRCSVRA